MKTKTLLFCIIIWITTITRLLGQKDSIPVKEYKYLELRGGLGVPLTYSPFGYPYNNGGAYIGYSGINIGLDAAFLIKKTNVGLIVSSSYSMNQFDANEYYRAQNNGPEPPQGQNIAISQNGKGNFQQGCFNAGIFFDISSKPTSSFICLKLLSGILIFQNFSIIDSSWSTNSSTPGYSVSNLHQTTVVNIMGDFGIEWRHLTPKYTYSVGIDFLWSNKQNAFNETKTEAYPPSQLKMWVNTYDLTYDYVAFTLSFGLRK